MPRIYDFSIDQLEPLLTFLSAKYVAMNNARLVARAGHDELHAEENQKDGYRFADILFLKHFFKKERKFATIASHHPKFRTVGDFFARMQYKNHAAVASGFNGNVDELFSWAAKELHADIEELRLKIAQCVRYNNELIDTAYNHFGPKPRASSFTPDEKLELTIAETITTGFGHVHKELLDIQRENRKAAAIDAATTRKALSVAETKVGRQHQVAPKDAKRRRLL